jgi:polygalacturonase
MAMRRLWVRMARTGLAIAAALAGPGLHAQPDRPVSVVQFGAVPDDGRNDAEALRAAMEYARSHAGSVIHFPPGTYDFRDEAAVALMQAVLAGKYGLNPEPTIFKAYFSHVKGLDLRGASGVTIDAKGARLLFDGWGEPVSVVGASDVAIKGLTIDYKRRGWSGGQVTAVGRGWFEARINPDTPVTARAAMPRVQFWDRQAHRIIGEGYPRRVEPAGAGKLRVFAGDLPDKILGSQVGLMHTYHFRPAILIQDSARVRIEGVTIHSQPGMGIVAHRCHDVTFSGLRVVPPPGGHFSTNTDATHLTSCTGLIRIENSLFEAHGDDATNIHGYYWSVAKGAAGRHVLTLPVNTHAGVLVHPDPGDQLEWVSARTLEPIGTARVRSVRPDTAAMLAEVELEGEIPADLDQVYLSDVTRLPRVEFVGNTILSHRARGVLIKTRNVLIERNLFLANTGTAIHVAAEGGWREGVPSANVVIRGNRFIANGYGDGTIHDASAIAVNIDAAQQPGRPLHDGLTIEDNLIDGGGARRCIYVAQTRNVAIRHNALSNCEKAIAIETSEGVAIEGNHVVEGMTK